jgi:membrane protein
MNIAQKLIHKFDHYQMKTHYLGFTVAVIKKYSSDEAGRHAALLTYYLFTALFPLLLVLTTVAEHIAGYNSHLEATVINGVTSYFPLLGSQLATHVHGLRSNGLPLVLGILFIVYGTRGVANSFGRGVRQIWGASEHDMPGFPVSTLKSMYLVVFGGLGFIAASISAGLAASAGHEMIFRCLSILVNLLILYVLFSFLINISLPSHIRMSQIRVGAAAATIGLVILQLIGGYLISRELKHLDALYSYFAVALGLLFWLYLQVQVFYYAIEIAVVSSRKLWPERLT